MEFPFLDVPNHVTRAVVLRDLWLNNAEMFNGWFSFELKLVPYIFGDVFLVLLVSFLDFHSAGKLSVMFTFLSFPIAVYIFMRVHNYSKNAQLIAMLLSLYLSTDWFFLSGFEHYRISIAMVLIVLALWNLFLDRKSKCALLVYASILVSCQRDEIEGSFDNRYPSRSHQARLA